MIKRMAQLASLPCMRARTRSSVKDVRANRKHLAYTIPDMLTCNEPQPSVKESEVLK